MLLINSACTYVIALEADFRTTMDLLLDYFRTTSRPTMKVFFPRKNVHLLLRDTGFVLLFGFQIVSILFVNLKGWL